jgi:tetratricopeptide (TPR) repeat protein
LLLSLLVVLVLPQWVSAPTGLAKDAAVMEIPAAVKSGAAAREDAEHTLQQFLQLQARLELGNAPVWGEPVWSEAIKLAVSGDRMFGERRFDAAAVTYADALHRLEQLDSRQEQIFTGALEAGLFALENNDPNAAQKQLVLALAVKPDHELATRSLARAKVRDDVLQRMAAGEVAEHNGDLEVASVGYEEALQLDGDYQPARDSLERVSTQLTAIRFRAAMSRMLKAMDNGQLNEAGKALEDAALLKPDDDVVHDARQRLTQARQQSNLSRLRRNAAAKVEEEDWQGAVVQYKRALQIDGNAGFARDGLARAEARIQLHQQFDHYLKDPQRLYSAEPLENAQALLSAAGEAPASEPRLANKINRLEQQVMVMRIPVSVRLQSDGETEVVVYHVARLGRFIEHRLELRPGTYTAVGSRPGYRDVRKVFSVLPGKVTPPVDIRCEEPV